MDRQQARSPALVMAAALVVSLVIGLGVGLVITRLARSAGGANDALASLGAEDREAYAVMVAAAYASDGDLARARAQLERLGTPNLQQWLAYLVERHLAEGRAPADTRALAELAAALGVQSQPVLAYLAALTPEPTDGPLPTETAAPSSTRPATPSPTLAAEVVSPSPLPPTATSPPLPTDTQPPPPTDTPQPAASDTPEASPSQTASHTPSPQPTDTPRPAPSDTPVPTNTPAAAWSWTAQLVGPGQEGQSCAEGHKLIRVTVLDAAGQQVPGVWIHEGYTGWYRVTGHKGDDPYWGPGEAEFSNLDGGRMCIASGEGGACESEQTRDLPCHDPPPFEDLWAAGYCECCEPGITREKCQALFEAGQCLGISHYAWRVEFKRSW